MGSAKKNALTFLSEERQTEQRRNELRSEGEQLEMQALQIQRQLDDLNLALERTQERLADVVKEFGDLPEPPEQPVGPGPIPAP